MRKDLIQCGVGALLVSLFLCGVCENTFAQTAPHHLDSLHSTRLSINKTAMLTLGAWAVGNMALNGALMLQSSQNLASGNEAAKVPFYFQQMNVFWNVINLGLAAGGYWGSLSEPARAVSLVDALEKQASIERILLFNAGLDCAYLAAAAWMLERSKTDPERQGLWQGYGQSLLLQGAFLLVFDVAVFAIQHTATEPLVRKVLESVQLAPVSVGAASGTNQGVQTGFQFGVRVKIE